MSPLPPPISLWFFLYGLLPFLSPPPTRSPRANHSHCSSTQGQQPSSTTTRKFDRNLGELKIPKSNYNILVLSSSWWPAWRISCVQEDMLFCASLSIVTLFSLFVLQGLGRWTRTWNSNRRLIPLIQLKWYRLMLYWSFCSLLIKGQCMNLARHAKPYRRMH